MQTSFSPCITSCSCWRLSKCIYLSQVKASDEKIMLEIVFVIGWKKKEDFLFVVSTEDWYKIGRRNKKENLIHEAQLKAEKGQAKSKEWHRSACKLEISLIF